MTAKSAGGYSLEKVASQAELQKEWWPIFQDVFPDKNDQEPLKQLVERYKDNQRNHFYIIRDEAAGNKAVGIEMRQTDPALPGAMYIPWAGVAESHRSKGIFQRTEALRVQQMKDAGVKYTLFEVEDPKRVHVAYPDQDPAIVRKTAEDRIRIWRRTTGSQVVRDPEIDYVRPSARDGLKTQAYDLLSIHVLDKQDPMWANVFNADKSAMSKSAYRRFYLETMRLQYGNKTEGVLRQELPAVDQMLTTFDRSPKQWVQLDANASRFNLAKKKNILAEAALRGQRHGVLSDSAVPKSGARFAAMHMRLQDDRGTSEGNRQSRGQKRSSMRTNTVP